MPLSRFPILRVVAVVCLCAAPLASIASPTRDRDLPSTLRVRLLEQLNPRTLTVDAPTGGLMVFTGTDPRPRLTIEQGGRVTLSLSGSDVRVAGSAGTVQASAVRLSASSGEAITLHVGSATRSYRGDIHASAERSSGALRLINHVPLEEYVASVVASEYGLDDVEGSKAMAVIARTYALKALKSDDYEQVDHTLSQVYKGTRAVTPRALEAARATAGEVLTHGGDLIVATYYSSSGGHTASNEDVWQAAPLPYLRARKDPWDAISPHASWTYVMEADRLHALLRDAFGVDARSVDVAERSDDGRVRTLRIRTASGRDRELSSQEFRLQVIRAFGPTALRSTFFDLRSQGGAYTFTGRGFGHGVGLSQWGAHAMALDGRSYREILDFYYRDVRLEATRVSDTPVYYAEATRPYAEATPAPGTTVAPVASADPVTRETPQATRQSSRAAAALRANAADRAAARPVGWSGRADTATAPGSTSRVISRRVAW